MIKPIEKQIEKIVEAINALPEQVVQASVFALNRTAEWMKGQVSKELSAEKRIKLKLIRDKIKMARADKKNRQSLLNCDFRGVLARDLGSMTQTPSGAKAGGRLFEHAFIASMKPGAKAGIYRRKTKKRFPVKSVTIPIFDEATKILSELIGDEAKSVFEKRFLHEIKRITGAL
ncbi:hypothetical protein FACS189449_08280 [Alphaproteobacteria bacterium]|nr:hypothetical protein FACS189449_08280 [Alphaproteobacteria bacterium]